MRRLDDLLARVPARIDPDAPFRELLRERSVPRAMREAPALPSFGAERRVQRCSALLINPFYPKDPHASFGKHVLTPTLALTSFAATTPAHWSVRYFDENLLQGSPPADPLPEVVGITVHLTFAARAFALADCYRRAGSKVILGGLHVLSCPDECAPHADALALGGAQGRGSARRRARRTSCIRASERLAGDSPTVEAADVLSQPYPLTRVAALEGPVLAATLHAHGDQLPAIVGRQRQATRSVVVTAHLLVHHR